MTRDDSGRPIDALDPPPRSFEDREGRRIDIHGFGERDANAEYEALVEMYVAFDPADRAQGIPPTGEPAIRNWLDRILIDDAVNVVAWHSETAVGHATLVPDRAGGYELAIFVRSSHQEAGIGTELIEALLGAGQRGGVERVWLTVEPWNSAAIRLYEKVGFESTSTEGFEREMALRLG